MDQSRWPYEGQRSHTTGLASAFLTAVKQMSKKNHNKTTTLPKEDCSDCNSLTYSAPCLLLAVRAVEPPLGRAFATAVDKLVVLAKRTGPCWFAFAALPLYLLVRAQRGPAMLGTDILLLEFMDRTLALRQTRAKCAKFRSGCMTVSAISRTPFAMGADHAWACPLALIRAPVPTPASRHVSHKCFRMPFK